jgi:hypothetical protein
MYGYDDLLSSIAVRGAIKVVDRFLIGREGVWRGSIGSDLSSARAGVVTQCDSFGNVMATVKSEFQFFIDIKDDTFSIITSTVPRYGFGESG